jgi:hypothetical protein
MTMTEDTSDLSNSLDEMPWAASIMEVVDNDIEASRQLLTRLLGLSDALLATTVTVGGLFVGVAASTKSSAIAFIAVPVMLALTYVDGLNWAQFRRVGNRIRRLEKLYQSYVVALRERATVRTEALDALRRDIDRYEYGVERQLRPPGLGDMWETNKTRARWWLLVVFSATPLFIGIALASDEEPTQCVQLADGSIIQTADAASVVGGPAEVVACPSSSATRANTTVTTAAQTGNSSPVTNVNGFRPGHGLDNGQKHEYHELRQHSAVMLR